MTVKLTEGETEGSLFFAYDANRVISPWTVFPQTFQLSGKAPSPHPPHQALKSEVWVGLS